MGMSNFNKSKKSEIDEDLFCFKFWYLFLITPRVLALAMFAATFRSWFWIILVAHWFGMLFWILRFVNYYNKNF
jgi:hypothetical protein